MRYLFITFFIISCSYEKYESSDQPPVAGECVDGISSYAINGEDVQFECNGYDLLGYVSLEQMNAESGNDCWGWTDPLTGKEYALMGLDNGTGIIDISDPFNPNYLGKIPTATLSSTWRDIKVYKDHAFIVSEAAGHGMQIFDLSKLRDITDVQEFQPDLLYEGYGHSHNIAINTETGVAYTAGTGTSRSPRVIHAVDITNPLSPNLLIEYPEFGYTHDAQVVIYNGPDQDHLGKELYVGSNEDRVVIVDITDKTTPVLISSFFYDHQYTHQSWLTEDHRFLLMGDELDEIDNSGALINKTRTVIIDLENLDEPIRNFDYVSDTDAIDHNGYVKGSKFYLASYTSGLRVIDILNIGQKSIREVGYFDTYPHATHDQGTVNSNNRWGDPGGHDGNKGQNSPFFNGAWSVYPYFQSRNIIISDINSGLFIVRKSGE